MVTAPEDPSLASPVVMESLPESPDVAVPVVRVTAPVVAEEVSGAEEMVTAPELAPPPL
jgi:hypothetical protein